MSNNQTTQTPNNPTERTEIVSSEDMKKLEALKTVPTDLDSIFSFSTEGKTIFDVVYALLGESKDTLSPLDRTHITTDECTTIAEGLWVSKYGPMYDMGEGIIPPVTDTSWFCPELRDFIMFLCRGRPSVGGLSRQQAIEALQQIKLKLETQQKPLSGV